MRTSPATLPRIVVIGAGFGGLGVAMALRKAGHRCVSVLERADAVGGAWRANTYPHAACDVPSSLYSWSFAPNPAWPRRYGRQPDILAYIQRTAAEDGVLDRVRTGVEVTGAAFDDETRTWRVRTHTGEEIEADVLVPAVGQLSQPMIPDLPGRGQFAGPAFHSARWRHDVELRGRSVAVVGTGASAIQFVPGIVDEVGSMTVFQRSAPYVVPKPDRAYTRLHGRAFEQVPRVQRFGRRLTRTLSEAFNTSFTDGGPVRWWLYLLWRAQLRAQVRDRRLRRALEPDYPLGCKRLLFANDWYPAVTRDHVEVVTEAVCEVLPHGVRTAGGAEHPADVIIWGTGFEATRFLAPMQVTGRGGVRLDDVWSDGACAHLGITVPGFPRMFLMYGPNTNLGGSSIIQMLESQADYVVQAVDAIAGGRAACLDVREDRLDAYDAEMQSRLRDTVWSSCGNWYTASSGRATTNWPGRVAEYEARTATFRLEDFEEVSD